MVETKVPVVVAKQPALVEFPTFKLSALWNLHRVYLRIILRALHEPQYFL